MDQTNKFKQNQSINQLTEISAKFTQQAQIANVQSFGSGNINDTFLVTLQGIESKHFVLQRINTNVFREPKMVMQNMLIYSNHVRDRLAKHPLDRQWEVPQVLLTKQGKDHWQTDSGEFWRSLSFIENSQSFDAITNREQAQEVGYALGIFHHLTSDLAPEQLFDTLEGFHITPRYLQQYEEILDKEISKQMIKRSPEVDYCLRLIDDHKGLAYLLEDAKAAGKLPLRTMHGDPKVNNILFDRQTNLALSVVDLDTIKAGLVHYDIGDCLRSACNPLGEDAEQWESVVFDTELCEGILQGYLAIARSFLTEYDYAYIYDAVRVITFELGLRFFTDYLAGNVYFHIQYPEHNLQRSLVQFRLLESIEAQESVMRKIIASGK